MLGLGSQFSNNSQARGEGEDGGLCVAGEGAFLTLAEDGKGCLVLLRKDGDLDSRSLW